MFNRRFTQTELNLKDARNDGFNAGVSGKNAKNNPHRKGTRKHQSWEDGRLDGERSIGKTIKLDADTPIEIVADWCDENGLPRNGQCVTTHPAIPTRGSSLRPGAGMRRYER